MHKIAVAAWLAGRFRAVTFRPSLLLACLLCAGFAAEAQTVAAPVFSVAAGSYTTAQSVAITDATAGSSIYYTTDGSQPTTKSFLYAGPIPIHQSLTINALAVVAGGGQSTVATAAYTVSGVTTSIATIGGTGVKGYSGDNGPATAAQLNNPAGMAVDQSGQVYIADANNSVVRKISTSGVITTVAGNNTFGFGGDGGPATSASLFGPLAVALDAVGNLYISDTGNQRVRKVTPAGIITTVVGNGAPYSGNNIGDGGPAVSAQISQPLGITFDVAGNLFIADADLANRVRKVTPAGIITTFAGTGASGSGGDGGPAIDAQLAGPWAVALDAAGNLYIADSVYCRIRMVDPAGIISTAAGNGFCNNNSSVAIGDGGPATSAEIGSPIGIVVDAAGFVYESDQGNRVRAISPSGEIQTVAGDGVGRYNGDGETASSYSLDFPEGIAKDANGNVYIADHNNHRVREVTFPDAAPQPTAMFGTMSFSPASSVPQNTSQAVTISDTLSYTGLPPTGTVAYVLNSISYAAVCTGSASPETCNATVPAATVAALPVAPYPVTGSFAGDANYAPASATGSTFTILAVGTCTVPNPATNSMAIAYDTVAATDRDFDEKLQYEVSSNFVLSGLGANGLPVYNPSSTASIGAANVPNDQLADGEITWWSPTLNNGGLGGASDVTQTGNFVVPLPFINDAFFPPNGTNSTGQGDSNSYQAAVFTGTLAVPVAEGLNFTIQSDDSTFIYIDGQIACSDGVIQGASPLQCTTSEITAGAHAMEVFYVDLNPTRAVLELNLTTSNAWVGPPNPLQFGSIEFSPSASEPFGTNQAIAIGETLTFPGLQPTGAVSFLLNGVSYPASCTAGGSTERCTATVPGATIAALPGGQYPVSSSFAGDCTYTPATSQSVSFTITAANTTTELAASATLLTFGQALNLTATVSSAYPVTGGTVSFSSGKTLLGSASLGANGVATLSLTLPVGSYSLTATYSGSADGLPSTSSPAVVVTVVPASSSTTLNSSLNPAVAGSAVTFTITVQSSAGTPTGSVTLSEGATVLAVLPLNAAATSTYTTSSLSVGPHNLTASYAANGNFAASQSAPLTQVILPPPTFTIAASAPLQLVTQHHGAVAITVTPVDGFSGPVTLSCGTLPQWATCEWGSATSSSTLLPVGAAPASTQLVVDTSAVLGYESSARGDAVGGKKLLLAGLALPALLLFYRRKRMPIRIAVFVLALLPLVNLSGCSGMLPYSTAPGTYSIPILGSSGNIQSSGTLTLVVTE